MEGLKEMREDTGNICIEVVQLPLPDLETENSEGLRPITEAPLLMASIQS